MVETILDCQAVVSGGMGEPMLRRLESAGMKVYLTRESTIDQAAKALVEGTLESDARLVHQHHEHLS